MNENDKTVFVNIDKIMPEMKGPQQETEHKGAEKQVAFSVKNPIEGELDSLYLKLGKAYYEGGFEDPLPELLPLFDRITGLKAEMEARRIEEENRKLLAKEEQKNRMAFRFCTHCGSELEKDAKFCGKCGCFVG